MKTQTENSVYLNTKGERVLNIIITTLERDLQTYEKCLSFEIILTSRRSMVFYISKDSNCTFKVFFNGTIKKQVEKNDLKKILTTLLSGKKKPDVVFI